MEVWLQMRWGIGVVFNITVLVKQQSLKFWAWVRDFIKADDGPCTSQLRTSCQCTGEGDLAAPSVSCAWYPIGTGAAGSGTASSSVLQLGD